MLTYPLTKMYKAVILTYFSFFNILKDRNKSNKIKLRGHKLLAISVDWTLKKYKLVARLVETRIEPTSGVDKMIARLIELTCYHTSQWIT